MEMVVLVTQAVEVMAVRQEVRQVEEVAVVE